MDRLRGHFLNPAHEGVAARVADGQDQAHPLAGKNLVGIVRVRVGTGGQFSLHQDIVRVIVESQQLRRVIRLEDLEFLLVADIPSASPGKSIPCKNHPNNRCSNSHRSTPSPNQSPDWPIYIDV